MVKKVRRPSSAMSSLPNGMDLKLKKHFDKYRDNNSLPPELKKHNIDCGLYSNMENLNVWRNNFKGISYMDKANGITLYGAVDELLIKDNKIIVLDFKTRGFALKEDTAHMYQDKINLYNLLFKLNGYEVEDYGYLLFYMPEEILEDGNFVFNTEIVKMHVNLKHAEDLFKKAIEVLNNSIPECSSKCKFCSYVKSYSV